MVHVELHDSEGPVKIRCVDLFGGKLFIVQNLTIY